MSARSALFLAQLALLALGCDSRGKPLDGAPVSRAEPSRAEPPAERKARAGTPKAALSVEARERVSTLRVSAHVGNVTIRRQGAEWVTAGENGCTVPARRIARALDDLTKLQAVESGERVPAGDAFELQIEAMAGESLALHLELADRNDSGDLVRLRDDSMVRIRGLDRKLWLPEPKLWCTEL